MGKLSRWIVLAALSPAVAAQGVAFGYGPDLFEKGVIVDQPAWGAPATADLNEDGRADLVVTGQSFLTVWRLLGQASGGLAEPQLLFMPDPVGPHPESLLGELDGDGHVDLLVRSTVAQLAITLPGLGNGLFAAHKVAGKPPIVAAGVTLADLDGDNDLDLVYSRGGLLPHELEWLPGHGDGTFGVQTLIAVATMPTELRVADVDDDGVPDLLCLDSGHVDVRLGLGGGSFALPQSYSSFAVSGLDVADMDLDGQLDLVHGGGGDAAVILHGAGDGSFGAPSFVQMAPLLRHVAAVDIERDGLPDLLGAASPDGPFAGGVVARRMDRDGPIGGPVIFHGPADLPAPLAAADFDGDGLVDVAFVDVAHHALLTFENALGPFVDLGFASSSAQGTPSLTAFGKPAAFSQLIVHETWLSFPSAGVLVVGLAPDNVPFLGGALVPRVDGLVPLPGNGVTVLQVPWPAGIPAGLPVYLQSLRATTGAGKVLSSALMLVSE